MSLKSHNILFKKRLTQAGFTLMEVMFATMAFALILLVMQMTFSGALGLRNRMQKRIDQHAALTQAMSVMKRDLENMIVTGGLMAEGMVCTELGSPEMPDDQLEFYSTTAVVSDQFPWGDVQKVGYLLGVDPIQTVTTNLGQALMRMSLNTLPLEANEEPPVETLMLDNVRSLQFEFFDGLEWSQTWDSSVNEPAVPLAVRAMVEVFTTNPNPTGRETRIWEVLVPILTIKPPSEESEGEEGEEEEDS
jgi:type II secretion system protein J